jgi:hypothetical protein
MIERMFVATVLGACVSLDEIAGSLFAFPAFVVAQY